MHNLHNLKHVTCAGTFDELLQQGGHFAQLIAQFHKEAEEQEVNALGETEAGAGTERSPNPESSVSSNDIDDHNTNNTVCLVETQELYFYTQSKHCIIAVQLSIDETHERAANENNAPNSSSVQNKRMGQNAAGDKAKLINEEEAGSGPNY